MKKTHNIAIYFQQQSAKSGTIHYLCEIKWQYCQNISMRAAMQIQRNFYLQQLIDGKQNGLIKINALYKAQQKRLYLFKPTDEI